MDRNTILAIFLMGVVLFGYSFFFGQTERQQPEIAQEFEQSAESSTYSKIEQDVIAISDSAKYFQEYGQYFAQFAEGNEQIVTVENDLIVAKISSKGSGIISWELKNYKKWSGEQSQLITENTNQLSQMLLSRDGKKINTSDLYFDFSEVKRSYSISEDQTVEFKTYLRWDDTHFIERSFKFFGNKYHFETDVRLVNLDNIIKNEYLFSWKNGLEYQEKNNQQESDESEALVVMNGEVTSIDATDIGEKVESSLTGKYDYSGVKVKYFGAAIKTVDFDGQVDLSGTRISTKPDEAIERYNIDLRVPYDGGDEAKKYLVFIGPLEPNLMDAYGFDQLVNYGWWIFRGIGYAIVQFFTMIYGFVGNWGITIIIFSVILKFMLYPLTRPQMKSMQKMKVLAPIVKKAKDKYPDDMQKQQQETMKIYSEYGVNPLGGCLPLLLQMPILYTLWTVFRNSIDLRQTEFIPGWITDLSVPDELIPLPFDLFGLESISGLALAMSVTMFIQQKMTVTDDRQKALIYLMPTVFLFMFSIFPAGLNLYYFVFNLIGIGQQIYWNKFAPNKVTVESLKAAPKKEGWLSKKMKEAQAMAEQQQRAKQGGGGNLQKHQPKAPKRRDTKKKRK